MKNKFLVLPFTLIALSFVNCSKSDSETPVVQEINLEGTWGITAMAYPTQGGTQNAYVNEIKNGQAVNDFYFLEDGKFKQISDMSGSGTLSTYEGTWKITGTSLTITLLIKGMQIDAVYTCEQKGDVLILTLLGPDKLIVTVSTFRKK